MNEVRGILRMNVEVVNRGKLSPRHPPAMRGFYRSFEEAIDGLQAGGADAAPTAD